MMRIRFATIAGGLLALAPCFANINLELRPITQTAFVGNTVSVGLYAVSDNGSNQLTAAMDVVVIWDPTKLNPISFSNSGAGYSWFQSGFLYPGGANASLNDGDAVWTAFAAPGSPAAATPAGLLVTTFKFQAIAATPTTTVQLRRSYSPYMTVVYDGTTPNTDVTGTLTNADVTILQTATVKGHVDLEVYEGPPGIGASLEFRQPSTITVLQSVPITLDGAGNYTAPGVIVGTYDVAVKFSNWLRQVRPGVVVTNPTTSGVDFALTNGDADDSNRVDLPDLNETFVNFASPGGPGDVTHNNSVDLGDLNLELINFAMTGDS